MHDISYSGGSEDLLDSGGLDAENLDNDTSESQHGNTCIETC
jgi:hypothetical protein